MLHEPVQIVHKTVPCILGILEVQTDMDGLDRAYFLAHPAENTPKLVDLVDNRISISLIVLAAYEPDAVSRANCRAKTACYAFRASV